MAVLGSAVTPPMSQNRPWYTFAVKESALVAVMTHTLESRPPEPEQATARTTLLRGVPHKASKPSFKYFETS
jgi:hypothetical protein